MNKPLLQYKREIEEEIKELNHSILKYSNYTRLEEKRVQLQMIDDIIEQKEKFIKWLKINIKEYEELRDSDRFNEYAKSECRSSILNYESVLDRVRGE